MSDAEEVPPVLVEVCRGGVVESRHRGTFAVVDAGGGVVLAAGPIGRPVFPRSAIKPLQALPLVESGAAAAFGLGPRELALACASHRGEPGHVEAVRGWLARLGLAAADLACGADPPVGGRARADLIRAGEAPSALHHQCSGKHAGFLCTALHLGDDRHGYVRPEHPAQRRVAAALSAMVGIDLLAAPCGVDGCSIPTFAMPLAAFARGLARLADPAGLAPARARAATTILDAMAAEPWFVEGTGGFATAVMQAAGAVRVKAGAEGVYAAVLPGRGLGVALKIEDGAARAAELAMATLLQRLGCLDAVAAAGLTRHLAPPVRSAAGAVVGELRPAAALG